LNLEVQIILKKFFILIVIDTWQTSIVMIRCEFDLILDDNLNSYYLFFTENRPSSNITLI